MPGNPQGANEQSPEDVLKNVDTKMDRAIDAMNRELGTLRTGRATPSLVENISVDYYGTPTPLNQIASISGTTLGQTIPARDRKEPYKIGDGLQPFQ